jgi:ribonuclease P protein component
MVEESSMRAVEKAERDWPYKAVIKVMVKFKTLFSFTKKEVRRVFSLSKLEKRGHGLKLLYAPIEEDASHGKFLIIVPRTTGKASKRNRIRRQVKSIFFNNKLYEQNKIFILVIYKEALELSFQELEKFLCG